MLDPPTLLVVLIVSSFLMAGALSITFAGRFRAGLGKWTASLVVKGLSWLLVTMRNDVPDFVTVGIATGFLVYCWSLQVSALLEFHNRPTPRWLMYGPATIAFLVLVIYVRDAQS